MDDVVGRCIGQGFFDDDSVFDRVGFEDFYRYVDVPLDEVYQFLENSAPWVRPSDTGRSTNCLINDAGIFVHRQVQGYHNYALPYAWDVRLGHKTRDQAIDELRDRIDTAQVTRTLGEVGFNHSVVNTTALASWVVVNDPQLNAGALRDWLADHLPVNLLPESINFEDSIPLTVNGKVDTRALAHRLTQSAAAEFRPLESEQELFLARCWETALGRSISLSRGDHFFGQGGDSMAAILLVDEVRRAGRTLSLDDVFSQPVLEQMALKIEFAEAGLVSDDDVDFGLSLEAGELDALVERQRDR